MDKTSIISLVERVEEVIDRDHLLLTLNSGKKLRVKLGIDPTARDLHLGHTVVLRKLRQFQDAGHTAVLIIGDFTALIGDPSGRNELRPQLTPAQVKENMRAYLKEAGKVLDVKKAEVRRNSEWYQQKDLVFFIDLMGRFTVARLLERDDFQKRLKEGRDITLLELLYPILQGYDSVVVRADVELGGTDQKFNLLMGRKVQKRFGQAPQDIVTLPLIEGLDGSRKMSKSYGNYIALSEAPAEMYGKVMSIPDSLLTKYFSHLTSATDQDIQKLNQDLKAVNTPGCSPKQWKERLAFELVGMYHNQPKARQAAASFSGKFKKLHDPAAIKPDFTLKKLSGSYLLVELLVEGQLARSKTEARRKILEGAVQIDGLKVLKATDRVKIESGTLIRLGKRFLKIV